MAKKKSKPRIRKCSKPDARKTIIRFLRDGSSLQDSAAEAGMSHDQLLAERKRDPEFAKEVDAAIIYSKRGLIKGASKKNPMQMLATRYPDEYGRKDRFALKDIVQLYDDWLEITLPFVPEERRDAFKDQLNVKLTRVAVNAGVIPEDHGSGAQ